MAQDPNAVGWAAYNSSTVAAPTGYSKTPSLKPSESGGGGTYGSEVAMAVIFYNELRKYQQITNNIIPTFDMGPITEVLGKGKYKVKLMCMGSVVTASSTRETNAANFSWSKPESLFTKGGLALVLMTNSSPGSPNGIMSFTIIAVKTMSSNGDTNTPSYTV